MPSAEERLAEMEKRLIRLERGTYQPVRIGTIENLSGIVYETPDATTTFAEREVRQGLVDVRFEGGYLIRNIPLIAPSVFFRPYTTGQLVDLNNNPLFYALRYEYPRVGDTVTVLWDGGKVYVALGNVRIVRDEDGS